MNDAQRLQLQNMVQSNNVEDQTELIRQLKHSHVLRKDIQKLTTIMSKYGDDEIKVHEEGIMECNFLFTYYTDIYNKVRKNEIDLGILDRFLEILQKIEDGELDQHNGSFMVGTILKELYVDSALKKAEKLDALMPENEKPPEPKKPEREISWAEFKAKNNITKLTNCSNQSQCCVKSRTEKKREKQNRKKLEEQTKKEKCLKNKK